MTTSLEKFFEEFPELKGTILEEILRRMQNFHYAQECPESLNRYKRALEEIKKERLNAIVEISSNGGKKNIQDTDRHFEVIKFVKFLLAETEGEKELHFEESADALGADAKNNGGFYG